MLTDLELKQESIFIPLKTSDKLHLKRIFSNPNGKVVFMLHGSIENGKIFYSNSGKGLASFLAKNGFDVYIADTRGRGESVPNINKYSTFGQYETINEDIPTFLNKITELRGNTEQIWIAHSWGGVLLASYFSKYPDYRNLVKSMVFLGTKRVISVSHIEKFIKINFFWYLWANFLIRIYGYLPYKKLGFGSDCETANSHKQTNFWVKGNSWIDPVDNFDYGKEIKKINLPPILSITGAKDTYLGHPKDVYDFVKELFSENTKYLVIGKESGFKQDYDHINLLTHRDALTDHFLLILDWITKND